MNNTVDNTIHKDHTLGFKLTLVLLFFEYFRLQSDLVFLKHFRIPMLLIIALTFMGVTKKIWRMNEGSTKAFMMLITVGAIYIPFAVNNYYAYEMTRSLVIYFLTYMAIKSFIDSKDRVRIFLIFWLILGMICAVKGIAGGGKIIGSGFLGDENDFALFLDMMLPIAYFQLFTNISAQKRLFLLFSLLVLLGGIVSSFSRGGLVGLVGVVFYCWLMTPKKVFITVFGVIVFFIALNFLPQEYKDDMATIFEGTSESTAGERIYSWTCALRMFQDYPLFGVGPGNFPHRFAEYEPPEKWKGRGHGGRAAHSLYFTLIPEFGIIGVVCFFLMIYEPYRTFNRNYDLVQKDPSYSELSQSIDDYRFLRKIIYGVLFGYLFAGIFISVLYYPHFWIIAGLLNALNTNMKKDIDAFEKTSVPVG
jgi:O-antigen ligase